MLKGMCLCGAVRYELNEPRVPTGHCDCPACRDANKAALIASSGVARDCFRWTAGEASLSMYEISPGRLRRFCSSCGSHVVDEVPAFSKVVVMLATLDRGPDSDSEHEWTLHPIR